MNITTTKLLLPLACAGSLLLISCGEKTADADGKGTESSETKGKKPSTKDMIAISRKIAAYKKEIGYKDTQEINDLEKQSGDDMSKLIDLKNNHPDVLALNKESQEAQEKLMQAVKEKDEAAKAKWGQITGGLFVKKSNILKDIPENNDLQVKVDAAQLKLRELQYEELSKTPKGKELADELKRILDAMGV